jgi:hypothetical protein
MVIAIILAVVAFGAFLVIRSKSSSKASSGLAGGKSGPSDLGNK